MKHARIDALIFITAIVSFLGFWFENLFLAATLGYMDNRNMRLPFLLGYGLAMTAIYLLFGTPQQPRLLGKPLEVGGRFGRAVSFYLLACVTVMVGEGALGVFVEAAFDITWWDYSAIPLHVTKFTSVPTSLAFGALITWFMGCVFPPIYRRLLRCRGRAVHVLAGGLALAMAADLLVSGGEMCLTGDFVRLWRIDLSDNPIYLFLLSIQ